MIALDGSLGEGGGQILRSALGLSLVTGKAFRIEKIRARRARPGLARQHLAAVRAAAEVSSAEVTGDQLGSQELTFVPGQVQPGIYRFDIGSAGSTSLVLQTLLPGLISADRPSRLCLSGGTHNPMAPPIDFLAKVFLPLLARQGPRVEVVLERYGFYPAGGGRVQVTIEPGPLSRLELLHRGEVRRRRICAVVSRLPISIARREVETARRRLGWKPKETEVREVDSPGPGNVVCIEIHYEHVTEVFTGFGQRGIPAEKVAARVAAEAKRYLQAEVPVGEHLADQLLLPMALAGGGRFRTLPLSQHARTNLDVLQRFLDLRVEVNELSSQVCELVIDVPRPVS